MKMSWIVVAASIAGCGSKRPVVSPAPGTPRVTVMTYNVNYGLAGDPATMQAIAGGEADVVFLQETTAAWESALREQLGATYPYMEFKHCCGAGGLGVLSKTPFEAKEYIPPETWFPAWRLVVQTAVGPVQVLTVHLRPGFSDSGSVVSGYFVTPKIRRREIGAFTQYLEPDLPTLVVGDFNENENGRAAKFLTGVKGFHDALPEFAPGAKTWRWHVKRLGTIRGRYDHIVYDERLEPLEVKVLQQGNSDHLPVIGTFVMRATG